MPPPDHPGAPEPTKKRARRPTGTAPPVDDLNEQARALAAQDADATDRLEAAHTGHIDALRERVGWLDKERRSLLKEHGEVRAALETKIAQLQGELDRFRPELARLDEAHSNALTVGFFVTAMLTLGSAGVSLAGYFAGYTQGVAGAGCAMITWGLALLAVATIRSHRKNRPG